MHVATRANALWQRLTDEMKAEVEKVATRANALWQRQESTRYCNYSGSQPARMRCGKANIGTAV